jgi:hypothetical protein
VPGLCVEDAVVVRHIISYLLRVGLVSIHPGELSVMVARI